MKTIISLPGELVVIADNLAQSLEISRSELCTLALQEYIANHTKSKLVKRINLVCEQIDTSLPDDIAHLSRTKLLEADW